MKRGWGILLASLLACSCFTGTAMAAEFPEESTVPETEMSEQGEKGFLQSEDLDQKFETLMQELRVQGFGKTKELTMPAMEGYTQNSMELFQSTYGDLLKELQLPQPEIPKDFSLSEFMQQSTAIRDSAFSQVKSSSEYQSVMGKLNVGSVWNKATQGLPNVSGLMSNSFARDFAEKAAGEKATNQANQAQLQVDTLKLFTNSGKTLGTSSKNSFWDAVKDVKDVLGADGDLEGLFNNGK